MLLTVADRSGAGAAGSGVGGWAWLDMELRTSSTIHEHAGDDVVTRSR